MRNLSGRQNQLVAEFLSNIGVAWFVAGVVGSFPFRMEDWLRTTTSTLWGIGLASIFLRAGLFFTQELR